MGILALQRDQIDIGGLKLREGFFILPPFGAQRLLPVGIGLDAIAIADMDGGLASSTKTGFSRDTAPTTVGTLAS